MSEYKDCITENKTIRTNAEKTESKTNTISTINTTHAEEMPEYFGEKLQKSSCHGEEKRHENGCGHRAWLEIDRKALAHNVRLFQRLLPDTCQLMPAVKAQAYGLGAVPVAKELSRLGIRAFCVASAAEGVELREHGITGEILILGYTAPEQFALLHRYQLTQTVVDFAYAKQLNQSDRPVHVHIAVDTGMHRIGERSEHFAELCAMFQMKRLVIDGIFSHLCVSDGQNPTDQVYTKAQAECFREIVEHLEAQGYHCGKKHLLASYGIFSYPEYAWEYARVGVALYGTLSDDVDTKTIGKELRPVFSMKARVASVRDLKAGETAGYGRTFHAEKESRIAVITIGYADGVPRCLSNGKGQVLIHGQRAPIVGRICMDQALIDVSALADAENVAAGDVVTLIGTDGEETLTAADMAEAAGTITNEILSRLGSRLERYVSGE